MGFVHEGITAPVVIFIVGPLLALSCRRLVDEGSTAALQRQRGQQQLRQRQLPPDAEVTTSITTPLTVEKKYLVSFYIYYTTHALIAWWMFATLPVYELRYLALWIFAWFINFALLVREVARQFCGSVSISSFCSCVSRCCCCYYCCCCDNGDEYDSGHSITTTRPFLLRGHEQLQPPPTVMMRNHVADNNGYNYDDDDDDDENDDDNNSGGIISPAPNGWQDSAPRLPLRYLSLSPDRDSHVRITHTSSRSSSSSRDDNNGPQRESGVVVVNSNDDGSTLAPAVVISMGTDTAVPKCVSYETKSDDLVRSLSPNTHYHPCTLHGNACATIDAAKLSSAAGGVSDDYSAPIIAPLNNPFPPNKTTHSLLEAQSPLTTVSPATSSASASLMHPALVPTSSLCTCLTPTMAATATARAPTICADKKRRQQQHWCRDADIVSPLLPDNCYHGYSDFVSASRQKHTGSVSCCAHHKSQHENTTPHDDHARARTASVGSDKHGNNNIDDNAANARKTAQTKSPTLFVSGCASNLRSLHFVWLFVVVLFLFVVLPLSVSVPRVTTGGFVPQAVFAPINVNLNGYSALKQSIFGVMTRIADNEWNSISEESANRSIFVGRTPNSSNANNNDDDADNSSPPMPMGQYGGPTRPLFDPSANCFFPSNVTLRVLDDRRSSILIVHNKSNTASSCSSVSRGDNEDIPASTSQPPPDFSSSALPLFLGVDGDGTLIWPNTQAASGTILAVLDVTCMAPLALYSWHVSQLVKFVVNAQMSQPSVLTAFEAPLVSGMVNFTYHDDDNNSNTDNNNNSNNNGDDNDDDIASTSIDGADNGKHGGDIIDRSDCVDNNCGFVLFFERLSYGSSQVHTHKSLGCSPVDKSDTTLLGRETHSDTFDEKINNNTNNNKGASCETTFINGIVRVPRAGQYKLSTSQHVESSSSSSAVSSSSSSFSPLRFSSPASPASSASPDTSFACPSQHAIVSQIGIASSIDAVGALGNWPTADLATESQYANGLVFGLVTHQQQQTSIVRVENNDNAFITGADIIAATAATTTKIIPMTDQSLAPMLSVRTAAMDHQQQIGLLCGNVQWSSSAADSAAYGFDTPLTTRFSDSTLLACLWVMFILAAVLHFVLVFASS